jgi:hypothetical protein
MKVALSSAKTSVLTRATRRNILEYTILHIHRLENLKSYIVFWDVTPCGSCKNHHIPEDTILHSHRRENLKYLVLIWSPTVTPRYASPQFSPYTDRLSGSPLGELRDDESYVLINVPGIEFWFLPYFEN